MSKYIHDGGSSIFNLISKALVRTKGVKKIRTSTGAFKSFSRGDRGKSFRFFSKRRNKSTTNLTKRMNYMNERISGKTQKIHGYSAKLAESKILNTSRLNQYSKQITVQKDKLAQLNALKAAGKINPRQLRELRTAKSSIKAFQKKQTSIISSFDKNTAKIKTKIAKARTNLNAKVTKYAAKQEKYKGIMEKKIYKSQKRLDKGFTKTCKNLKKTGKSAIGCLEAFEKCKASGHGLDLKAMTGCVNTQSAEMGLPSGLDPGTITQTMTKQANKHFIRVFKRGRHLREIKRISSGTGAKLEKSMSNTAKTLDYGKTLGQTQTVSGVGALSKARTRQLTGQEIAPGTGIKDFSSPQATQHFLNVPTQRAITPLIPPRGVTFTPDPGTVNPAFRPPSPDPNYLQIGPE